LIRGAIGVAGLIAPRIWQLNQTVTKVAPAIAAGCTMVLKPSEIAPFNAVIFAEVMHAAGDTVCGRAAYVQSGDLSHARAIARHLRAGQVHLNYQEWDTAAPFRDYKQSGNGREYAEWGIHDFLEVKAIIGYGPSE
jgi:acyl-CoA reductase-like NAD-dependent aldehyde dehydrogenase